MRKYIYLLFTIFAITGCSGSDEKKEDLPIGTIFDGYAIGKDITPIGGSIVQTDTTKYIIVGTTERGVWTGVYERKSKNILSQNVYSASLPTTSTIAIGNNQPQTYHIDSFQSPVVRKIRENILFTLYGLNNTTGTISSYLCKIENGVFYIKEYSNADYKINDIYEWSDNTYFAITSRTEGQYYIIDDKFNEIFQTNMDYSVFPRTYIDKQDIIYFHKGEITRTDIKNNNGIFNMWTTRILDANAEVSNCKLTINSNILTFTCNYIQNGSKETLNKTIDISTGKVQ